MPDRGAERNRPRLLVTGASGLLGANFVAAAAASCEVVACYHRHHWQWPGTESVALDLTDAAQTAETVQRAKVDVIVHFAADTNVDRCEEQPAGAHKMNVQVTELLARLAQKQGAYMLLMSTDSVFDGRRGGYTESDEPLPINHYARSKREAEEAVRTIVSRHLVVRANIYGWNAQPKASLAEWVLGRLESGLAVPGYVDAVFSPLLVNTLAEVMLALLEARAHGVVHAASSDAISKHDFAVAIAERFGHPREQINPASMAGAQLKAPRPFNTTLRSLRLEPEFGLKTPTVRQDLVRFKQLRDSGFASELRKNHKTSHEKQ